MKRYTIEVIIESGSDEYWDELVMNNLSGADDIVKIVTEQVDEKFSGNAYCRLVKYEDTGSLYVR